MNPRNWAWTARGGFIAAAVVLAIALISGIIAMATSGDAAEEPSAPTSSAAADDDEPDITFRPGVDTVPAEAQCTDNAFVDHSIRMVSTGNPTQRQFATAVSIPFAGTTDAEVTDEITAEVCGNPTYLRMIAEDMLLWDVNGAEANKPWIQDIIDQMNADGLDSFAGTLGDDPAEVVNDQFQEWAGWLNTVLLNFSPEGQQSLASVRNWELPAIRDPRTLPIAQLATVQESKPAWVRTLRDKVGTCLMIIGFNAEDRRLEVFECATPPSTPPTPPPTTPPTTPPPVCTVDCTPPPTCPPETPHGGWVNGKWVCKDDPVNDPENQGNNKPGGGGQAPPQTDPVGPPAAGTPPVVYTPPPAAPPVTTPPVGSTPDPAPAPTPEPSASPSSDAEDGGCSPAPGETTC